MCTVSPVHCYSIAYHQSFIEVDNNQTSFCSRFAPLKRNKHSVHRINSPNYHKLPKEYPVALCYQQLTATLDHGYQHITQAQSRRSNSEKKNVS